MSALTCDICGGNLTMNESGEFAICESCGMKHDKRRVQAKVQEITGIVEVTKGEAEKERLIKNAETFINLGKIDEAEKIYAQLVKEFPNEWIGWAGNAYIQLLHFPCSFCRSDIDEFMQNIPNIPEKELFWVKNPYDRAFYEFVKNFTGDYKYSYKQFKYYSDIASKLAFSDFERYIEEKWKSHDNAHNIFIANIENKINEGTPCFNEIKIFFSENAFIPSKLRKIISQLGKNAAEVNAVLIKNINKCDNIYSLGKTDFKFDSDGTKKIEKIAFLSSAEAVLLGHFWQGEYGDSSSGIILTFQNKFSVEKLIDILLKPTTEEQSRNWLNAGLCEKCGSNVDENSFCKKCNHLNVNKRTIVCEKVLSLCRNFPDQVNLLEEIYSRYDHWGKKHDGGYDALNSPRNRIYIKHVNTSRITNVLIDKIDILSDSGSNVYVHYTAHESHGMKSSYSLVVSCDDIPSIINYLKGRTIKNKCQVCGGSFKGLITKVCTNCGNKKNF